jgi:hypothetical protein
VEVRVKSNRQAATNLATRKVVCFMQIPREFD